MAAQMDIFRATDRLHHSPHFVANFLDIQDRNSYSSLVDK